MANYSTSANVVLSVNGRQAQQVLNNLQKDARRLEQQISKAAVAGDKATMKKLQRELNSTNKLISQLQGSAKSAAQVLARLDKASPKELKSTLRTLQQQLNGIQRGSKAWDAQIAKIRAVKTEINRLNASLAAQRSLWDRFNSWLNSCQTAILGLAAAITGLVMAGRKAVNAFAEMEEQLANTRKYTGLTEEKVLDLNEAFKKMDTRTPREKLNELAQEAGRLGLNTLEAVQGYVEAADIINVALVDLGEGATQTIAKLTNIFGVEELLGTKDAMLAVGSTVNVLSQNCTASKPYLVEFAQRMAGIGSQAGLTIPEIIAFGAVLDANGQKVEMSATAIQKVIMNLANKNQEFAKTLGLDAELLNSTLKRSAKDGLLMFLQALHDIGEASDYENATMILAPAFKDMGLDAARVSQVLSTLAKHIDEVKWQIGEANKAFNEASSATREYEIFNNTAQASIDKAKKRVNELAVELGEKLYPIMRHIYTASGVFLRVLNEMVTFFIEHKKAIVTLSVSLAAYNVIVGVYNARVAIATKATALWNAAVNFMKGAIPAVRLVLSALVNVVQYFTNGLEVNYTMQQRWRSSMEAMKFKSWVGLIIAVGAAIYGLTQKFKSNAEVAEEARRKHEEFIKSTRDIDEASAQYCANELARLDALYKEATNEAKSKDERRKAAEKLQALYPAYFKNLSTEIIMVGKAKTAYEKLRSSILATARARAAEDRVRQNTAKLIELQEKEPELRKNYAISKKEYEEADKKYKADLKKSNLDQGYATNSTDAAAIGYVNTSASGKAVENAYNKYSSAKSNLDTNLYQQKTLNNSNDYLIKTYGVDIVNLNAGGNGGFAPDLDIDYNTSAGSADSKNTGSSNSSTSANSSGNVDKFEKEKQWREQMEAYARIDYATGVKNYIEFTETMDNIAVEFYEKQLEHTDITQQERLSIEAQYYEAKKERDEHFLAASLEEEQLSYDTKIAELKQFYIDGQTSQETYDLRLQQLELEHLKKLVNLQKEGTKERLQAENTLNNKLIEIMENRRKEQEKLEEEALMKLQEIRQKYMDFQSDYMDDVPSVKRAKYEADLAMLSEIYDYEMAVAEDSFEDRIAIEEMFQKAKIELQKKYGIQAEENSRSEAQKAIEGTVDWLKGDGGKALTGTMDALVSGMSSIFSGLSSMMQAELELQTAEINKRYDAEISRAEGNSFRVKQLEEQKEKEIAKAKKETNRKMFAMQVIQAVAQTAQGAINAYSSAAAVPVTGWILAPIAAGLALAAGAIQIAAIKKQQQASETQGYSEGGFTPEGDKDKPVGIVHAGEWVASQKLTRNPKTRPLLEALDKAQRNNTIGSITAADVSRSIIAPMALAASPVLSAQPNVIVNVPPQKGDSGIGETLAKLNDRLNQPFVTVNTVSGDHGIQRAQDEYDLLMKNKSPKSKK